MEEAKLTVIRSMEEKTTSFTDAMYEASIQVSLDKEIDFEMKDKQVKHGPKLLFENRN